MDGDSGHNSGGSGGSKVGKLIPRKLASRRRKQASDESFASVGSSDLPGRGRSPGTRSSSSLFPGSSQNDVERSQQDNVRSGDDELELDEEYVESDDDSLARSSSRPAVPSTHPSQIGQLTTSSPVIQSEHVPEVRTQDNNNTQDASNLRPPSSHSVVQRSKSGSRLRDVFRSKKSASNLSLADNQPVTNERGLPHVNGDSVDTSEQSPQPKGLPARLAASSTASPTTPTSADAAAPVIVNTPPTPTESRRSEDRQFQPHPDTLAAQQNSNSNIVVSPSGRMISHRRLRSGSGSSIGPSRLSNVQRAPLTPTPEDSATPPTPSGFFSSVINAASNAATSFGGNFSNGSNPSLGSKPKSSLSEESLTVLGENNSQAETVTEKPSDSTQDGDMADKRERELAVKTLGSGELSLDQLGISDAGSPSPTPMTSRFSDPERNTTSRGRSGSIPSTDPLQNVDGQSDSAEAGRPKSARDADGSEYEAKSAISRTGSIRSAMGRNRRQRGSTGGTTNTGMTIGAAISAANASVAHPTAGGQKLTGFAVASKKRNREFHQLFKSVPDDEYLIEDYSCALQKEILAHGRIYVSEGHLCFTSNILGWSNTLVMSFDEIVSVEKKSTALVFKNGLMITTLHTRHVFASFTSRDSTYDLIVNIWKLGHPNLRSMLNGVSLGDETNGDRTVKVDDADGSVGIRSASVSDDEDSEDGSDIYDEDEDDSHSAVAPVADAGAGETELEKAVTRKVSGAMASGGIAEKPENVPEAPGAQNFPGPAAHAPTDCGDVDSHYDTTVGDDIIPAPLGKVYDLMFGPTSVTWMTKWLTVEQKCTELQMEDKKGLVQDNKSRTFSYIKPLYASIGPKSTKCITTEVLENIDLEKSVNVVATSQTPDVPSGNVFTVKTRYCLTWAENNSTRVTMNCTLEWTGKSWLKGPIEKGAKDGQATYAKDVFFSLKAAVSSKPAAAGNGTPGKGGKKKKGKGKMHQASREDLDGTADLVTSKSKDSGMFGPLQGIFGPILDIIKPVLTGNVVYGLLVGLLVASFFGFGRRPLPAYNHQGIGLPDHADRLVAYEAIWRREESDLWDWLEERVGIHRLSEDAVPMSRKRVLEPHTVEERIRQERANEREIEEAIRVTEEKLQVLKEVLDKKQVNKSPSSAKVEDLHSESRT